MLLQSMMLMKARGEGEKKKVLSQDGPITYFGHRIHLLAMGGDSPESLGWRACRRVLLHQIWKVDVACKAIAGGVARAFFVPRLQRGRKGKKEKNLTRAPYTHENRETSSQHHHPLLMQT